MQFAEISTVCRVLACIELMGWKRPVLYAVVAHSCFTGYVKGYNDPVMLIHRNSTLYTLHLRGMYDLQCHLMLSLSLLIYNAVMSTMHLPITSTTLSDRPFVIFFRPMGANLSSNDIIPNHNAWESKKLVYPPTIFYCFFTRCRPQRVVFLGLLM